MPLPTVLTERILTFPEVAEFCPSVRGRKVKRQTIYFWIDTGVLINGARVKLESARLGGRRVTSVEAVERFLTATSEVAEPPAIVSPAQRRKETEAAMQRLREAFAKVGTKKPKKA